MKKVKKLDINYKVYTALLIRQKLPYLLVGLVVILSLFFIIFKKTIISAIFQKKVSITKSKDAVKQYVVQAGEDLWQIAEKNYGSGFNAYDIAQTNNLKEPYILQLGQKLIIPSVAKRFPTQGSITPVSASQSGITGKTYVVKEGDFLFQIAQEAYGDGNLVQKIIDANKIPEPYTIEVGQQLFIPR
ncbi:MAG: LysM peptidoglycan-binding domain-containing protein [Patescibacteria group bacterium]